MLECVLQLVGGHDVHQSAYYPISLLDIWNLLEVPVQLFLKTHLLLCLFLVIIMATAKVSNADAKLALNDVLVKNAKQYFVETSALFDEQCQHEGAHTRCCFRQIHWEGAEHSQMPCAHFSKQ